MHKTAGKALPSGRPPSFQFPYMLACPSTQLCPVLEPFPRARLNPLRTKEHLHSIEDRRIPSLGSPERQHCRRKEIWLCHRAVGLARSKAWASAWCDMLLTRVSGDEWSPSPRCHTCGNEPRSTMGLLWNHPLYCSCGHRPQLLAWAGLHAPLNTTAESHVTPKPCARWLLMAQWPVTCLKSDRLVSSPGPAV